MAWKEVLGVLPMGWLEIMHVLMDMELKPDEAEDVKGTLRHMTKNHFPSGNYPFSEGSESDQLVHWCHGAPGVTRTLVKAVQGFGDEEFSATSCGCRGGGMEKGSP
ncbi:hypothetical protein Ddye_026918 [Dipteronia dyeriana]|uniref:Uncharacterized protein n=1 Tax=Dipteronia dyeriana TaxID=168575 RepID=A0AAD9WQX2_9ROSI|nr:hypothetical protein Ddye_026918 [Dipteronia dyeriana]